MRKFTLSMILLCFSICLNAQIVSIDEALTTVLKNYSLNDTYEIYQHNTILSKGDIINTITDTVTTIQYSNAYVFFIDKHPYGNWAHECEYVIIDASYGTMQVIAQKMPPIHFDNYTLVRGSSTKPILNKALVNMTAINENVNKCSSQNEQYAIIINGGYDAYHNWNRYWNDCSFIYRTLVNTYGYDRFHIYVLMSDGTSSEEDMHIMNNTTYISSPLDLDGDGIDDINIQQQRKI